jgi:thiol-disulfide isomerase/thioredoxin
MSACVTHRTHKTMPRPIRVLGLVLVAAAAALAAVMAVHHREGIKHILRQALFGPGPVYQRPHLNPGTPLPDLRLTSITGVSSTIRPRPGRVLVIDVFATWCPDCITEAPVLAALSRAEAGQPVDIVGIDQEEYPITVYQFARTYGWNFPLYIDDRHLSEHVLGVHYIPATFVVDAQGIVRANVAGPLSLARLKQLIAAGLRPDARQG